jgi:hypothetical protein
MRNRSVLAIALLLLFTQVASAADLAKKYTKGDWIGSGTFKGAYTVLDAKTGKPVPGKVLVIVERTEPWEDFTTDKIKRMLSDEKAQLDRLEAAGVPAVQFDAIGTYEGQPAAIEPAYAISNREWMSWADVGEDAIWRTDMTEQDREGLSILNKKSLASIKKIRKALADAKLFVRDPQVLIAKDGTIVVADPMEVKSRTPDRGIFKQRMDSMLDLLEAEAQRQIALKAQRLNSAFPGGADVGPDASDAEVTQFAADVQDRGGVVRRAQPGELPEDVQAQTYLSENGQPTVVLPEENAPVKKVALVDELTHVEQLAKAVAEQGVAGVRKLFQDAAAGEAKAQKQILDWEAAAKRRVLSLFEPGDATHEQVAQSLRELENSPGATPPPTALDGLTPEERAAIRGRGNESPTPGISGELHRLIGDRESAHDHPGDARDGR